MALVLLAEPALAEPCVSARHIELPESPTEDVPRVCISPGLTTVFSFDAPLVPGAVLIEGVDGFSLVEPGASTLKLVPSERVPLGKELNATVRFADNLAPRLVTVVLVVHAAEAASLVEVHRRPRTAESYRLEVVEKDAEIRRLRQDLAQLRLGEAGPGSLTGLIASNVLGDHGVTTRNLSKHFTQLSSPPLRQGLVVTYRSSRRVAVAVSLRSGREVEPAWEVAGAALTPAGRAGEGVKVLSIWQAGLPSSAQGLRVVVEAESPLRATEGTFTLKLWSADGKRSITLDNVTFE
ncbi:DUF2381 family protein [Myxococcaceae bacterium GXIMD 01537]